MSVVQIRVPDLGDSKNVTVIDVLVTAGATIRADEPLITLESEKASMDVPAPVGGVIASIDIKKGQQVSEGTLIATVTVAEEATASSAPTPAT